MRDVTVIIPACGQATLTEQCLEGVLPERPERVVVVDDGSPDASLQRLARYGDRVQVVTHAINRGFAVSCNDGAGLAVGRYLIFLNNDTIPQAGWLAALVGYAERHPEAAMVGSKLVYPDQTIQHAGVAICQDRYPRHLYTGFPADHPAVNRSRRFQIVTAACVLVRRDVFEQADGFDEGYRNGLEDVDLCLRLGQEDREIHYCAESVVIHLESVSPGRFKHDRQNVELYRTRWWNRVRPDDLQYYLEDGLLQFRYEGRYPIILEVSPLLATVDADRRSPETEHLLRERGRQVAELLRENTRLGLELGARAEESPELRYRQMRQRIRETLPSFVPPGATILVVSRGDGSLLEFPGRQAWHFPRTEQGAYAGHHPADSAEAIAHLEQLRARGARYLLIPAPSCWWMDHYLEFGRHLEAHYTRIAALEDTGQLFSLHDPGDPGGTEP